MTDELIDEYMLKMLIKHANDYGATLQLLKHKKCPFIICGHLPFRTYPIKICGTAEWLYDELLDILVRNNEQNNKRWKQKGII